VERSRGVVSAPLPERHLRVVVPDTGQVLTAEEVGQLQARIDKLEADRKNLEKDIRGKRRQITELQRDKVRERLDHPDREFIKRVAVSWWRVCRASNPRIDPLAPNRFDAVAALAEMEVIGVNPETGKRERTWRYEAEHFKAAIAGAQFDPFETTHRNGKVERHNDLAQVCKDTTRFERFIQKCPYEVVPILPARPRPADTRAIPASVSEELVVVDLAVAEVTAALRRAVRA
jgi:hypothetical protein